MKKRIYLILFFFLLSACGELNGLTNAFISPEADDNRMVVLNTATHVYHDNACGQAKNCTKNCIVTTKRAAKLQGALPCQKCHGGNK